MIRIAAGQFKGLRLATPRSIRATEDKVRQALMNILGEGLKHARVVDGFAGSGALGIEALSRGAAFVAFIESDGESVVAIRDNLERLKPQLPRSTWRVLHMEAQPGLRELATTEPLFDIILFDPPYRTPEGKKALNTVGECAMLAPSGIVAVEHHRHDELPESAGPLRLCKRHRYGDTVLSFYRQP